MNTPNPPCRHCQHEAIEHWPFCLFVDSEGVRCDCEELEQWKGPERDTPTLGGEGDEG